MQAIEFFCLKYDIRRGKRGVTGKVHSTGTLAELRVKLVSGESQSMLSYRYVLLSRNT